MNCPQCNQPRLAVLKNGMSVCQNCGYHEHPPSEKSSTGMIKK